MGLLLTTHCRARFSLKSFDSVGLPFHSHKSKSRAVRVPLSAAAGPEHAPADREDSIVRGGDPCPSPRSTAPHRAQAPAPPPSHHSRPLTSRGRKFSLMSLRASPNRRGGALTGVLAMYSVFPPLADAGG